MMMEDRSNYVRVTNRTGLPKPVTGRFDGKDYVFPEGKPVDIPLLVAQHIFDFGRKDKTTALSRLGWAHTTADLEEGLEKLAMIKFEDLPEMIEKPKVAGARGRPRKDANGPAEKTGTAGPPVTAGGTEGEGDTSPDEPGDDEDDGEGEDDKDF